MNRKQLNNLKQAIHKSLLNESESTMEPQANIDPVYQEYPGDFGWQNPLRTWPDTLDFDIYDRTNGPWSLPKLGDQFQWYWNKQLGRWDIRNHPDYYRIRQPDYRPTPKYRDIFRDGNSPLM